MKKSNNEIDAIFQSANMGDRLWLFFHKNTRKLILTFSIIACVILFFGVFSLLKSQYMHKTQKIYESISTDDDRISFIKKYPSSVLAGITALKVADKSFSLEDFSTAYDYYTAAYRALKHTILQHRAQIGQGLSKYQSGNTNDAKKILTAIVDDRNADVAFRSCAAYYLAAILQSNADAQSLTSFLQHVETLKFPHDAISAIKLSAGMNTQIDQGNL